MASPVFSDPGVAIATFLHTFGAIGYMGGIAFYVGWARSVRRGHDNPTVLATGASLTYVSILANLLGGFVRTYLPGHPGLSEFGSSSWVTLMTLKHVALFAGMAAAVYLFELHAPRLRRAAGGQPLAAGRERNARAMLGTVVVSIVLAAVLGGVTTVLDLGDAPTPGRDGVALLEAPEPITSFHNGSITSGSPESGSFNVPSRASRIEAVFVAQPPQGLPVPHQVTLQLRDPTGATTTGDTPTDPTGARSIALEVAAPAAGRWDYVLTSDTAAATSYTLRITVVPSLVLEETVTLAAEGTFEINTQADAGAMLGWEWDATMHVEWNIHTHAGGFQAVVEEHTDASSGTYTVQDGGGHSFFWYAEGATTLSFTVWGDFAIVSIVDG